MKNRKEKERKKRVGVKYLDKRNYCVGTERAMLYIGILVSSTTTGPWWLSGSGTCFTSTQAKASMYSHARSIPSSGKSFFSFQPLIYVQPSK